MAPLRPYDLRTAAGRGPERFPAGHRWDSFPKIGFAKDSPLERDGFEPSVPGTKEPVFVAEGELRDRTGAAKKGCFLCGTDGSNPSPSSGESVSLPELLSRVENPAFRAAAWRPGRQRDALMGSARMPRRSQ